MKFCPLRSTAEKEVECSENCAFFAKNNNCAITNIGNMELSELDNTIRVCTDSINSELCEIRNK